MTRNAVTEQIGSFLCALTPFMTSSDIRVLARVTRLDHAHTDAMWSLCASLCHPKTKVQPTYLGAQALRHGTMPPFCRSYLWSVAASRVQEWLDCLASLQSGGRCCIGFMTIKRCRCALRSRCSSFVRCEYTVGGDHRRHSFELDTKGESGCTHTIGPYFPSCPWLQSDWRVVYDVLFPLGRPEVQGNLSSAFSMRKCPAPPSLLLMLIHLGEEMDHVYVNSPKVVDQLIFVWFTLGVAPRLRLKACFSLESSAQYRLYREEIDVIAV
jgi:hypothetical protein